MAQRTTKLNVTNGDLRLARIFLKIVENGGISASEEELGVNKSTISRHLADFETRLGLTLCERGRSGFRLTLDGERVVEFVERLLASVDDFSTNISGLNEAAEGHLRIGAMDSCINDPDNPTKQHLYNFKKSHPNVNFSLKIGKITKLERAVMDGRLHAAILPLYWQNDSFDYFELYQERVGLFAGQKHAVTQAKRNGQKLTVDDVYQHPLISRGSREPPSIRSRKAKFAIGPTVPDGEAIMALVTCGLYLSFMPTYAAMDSSRGLVEILPDKFAYKMPVCLVSKKTHQHSTLVQRFLEFVAQGIEKSS
ncbi:HTH-type transcriptional regulator GltC [Roseovarius albus]|uniref:HTH-type transcriptional regulator GltC n=2 Tax=Roseovarius albus TaxID=1247867 RepID=A0A1X6YSF2_9RHOB|nr:HTH-type transcriptional regulator GltC [Roseovarius albus]